MKTSLALIALIPLAACGGGSSSTSGVPVPQSTPASHLVTPHFTIVVPAKKTGVKAARSRNFISPSTASIVIALTSVNGSSTSLPTPSSVETDISSATCASGCTVAGPVSPPGVVDAYSFTIYSSTGGTGTALGTGMARFTPVAGQDNSTSVTMLGIPYTVTIAGVPTTWIADTSHTGASAQALTVTVADAGGNTITGTYAHKVTISDPNSSTNHSTSLSGTNAGTGCPGTCVDLTASTDTVSLAYGGLAENPVTLTSSGTNLNSAGTATFTPLLNAIVPDASNPTSTYTPCASSPCYGLDLFTIDSSASAGYSGTLKYQELGYTDSPYNHVLSTSPSGCSFAGEGTPANANDKTSFNFVATSATVGHCVVTVTDGLTDQTNAAPTFVLTYVTSSFSGNDRPRHAGTP